MDIKISENGSRAVLFLKGHLDTHTAKEADAVFLEVSGSHDEVVLDMAELNYLSSAGIRVLRNSYMTMYKKGGKFSIVNAGETVLPVLEMTGLLDLLR